MVFKTYPVANLTNVFQINAFPIMKHDDFFENIYLFRLKKMPKFDYRFKLMILLFIIITYGYYVCIIIHKF